MSSLDRRIVKLEAADSPIRYILVHGDEEAEAFHRWSAAQPPSGGATYVVTTNIPRREGEPLPPWL